MKRILLCITLLLLPAPRLAAQKVGTTSLQFLKVMPTARAAAMGDAFVTLAAGADAVFWNPAGIVRTTAIDVTGTITMWLFDTRQGALAAAIPLEEYGTIGIQLQYVDFGSIEVTRTENLRMIGYGSDMHYNPGLTGETFSPFSYLVGVSYAKRLTDRFSTGGTVKFLNESLWGSETAIVPQTGEKVNTYARVVLFDFGMQYNTGFKSIKLGIAVQNFGSQVKFAKESYSAPLAFRIGTAADLLGPDALLGASEQNRVTLAYDLFQPNDYTQQMHVGLEYGFEDFFFLRGGYKINYDNDNLTFGAGVRYPVEGIPLSVDYSYGNMGSYLPAVHRISVGVQFK